MNGGASHQAVVSSRSPDAEEATKAIDATSHLLCVPGRVERLWKLGPHVSYQSKCRQLEPSWHQSQLLLKPIGHSFRIAYCSGQWDDSTPREHGLSPAGSNGYRKHSRLPGSQQR